MARAKNEEVDVDAVNKTEIMLMLIGKQVSLMLRVMKLLMRVILRIMNRGMMKGQDKVMTKLMRLILKVQQMVRQVIQMRIFSEKEAEEVDVNSDADNISDSNGSD